MSDPTCVIMHPLSFTPHTFSDEPLQEENPIYGVGDSVSFGRYMTDNLEWEKWSSFSSNRNRHVEEAEKFSKPGSVKQKKAYFEAHFKRMAALKAAALLEQANTPQENTPIVIDTAEQDVHNSSPNLKIQKHSHEENTGFVVHQNDLYSVGENVDETEAEKLSYENVDEACNQSNDYEPCGITQWDKPPLQKKVSFNEEAKSAIVKKKTPLSSYMSPTVRGTGGAPMFEEPAGSIYPGKENYATPTRKKSSASDPDKKRTPLRMTINREINRIISPVIRKIGSSSRTSKDCSPALSTPSKVSVNCTVESPTMTPSRGDRSLFGCSPGENKVKGPRWQIFSADASMSPGGGRHRISSPIIPRSFCLTRDSASRRKQKLEEKFNATVGERAPQTSKFKGKAGAELSKFRQSFCFKAMSSPEHYRDMNNVTQQDACTQGNSPQRGRQPNRSTSLSKTSLPPRGPIMKQYASKASKQKKNSSAV